MFGLTDSFLHFLQFPVLQFLCYSTQHTEVKWCFLLRLKPSSPKPSLLFCSLERSPEEDMLSLLHRDLQVFAAQFSIINLASSPLDRSGFSHHQIMCNHLGKKNKTNVHPQLGLKELDSMEMTRFHSGCADVTRNPHLRGCQKGTGLHVRRPACRCVGGLAQPAPPGHASAGFGSLSPRPG